MSSCRPRSKGAPVPRFGRRPTSATDDRTAESRANVAAVTDVVEALTRATTSEEAIRTALDLVRERFGWAYGSYWRVDPAGRALTFVQESGSAGDEFRQVTLAASFREGVGLAGRAWRARDLVFVPDLGRLGDCVRAPGRPAGRGAQRHLLPADGGRPGHRHDGLLQHGDPRAVRRPPGHPPRDRSPGLPGDRTGAHRGAAGAGGPGHGGREHGSPRDLPVAPAGRSRWALRWRASARGSAGPTGPTGPWTRRTGR